MGDNEASVVAEIAGKVGELGVSAADIAGQVSEVAARSQRQMETIQQLSSQAEDMVATNKEIAANITHTKQTAESVIGAVSSATTSVADAVKDIHQLVEGVEGMEQRLSRLSEALSGVAKVASDIEKIASQTNLLALNATIEAARAGDAGKGFAVVASEVKALADETRKATVEIAETVGELTGQVSQIQSEGHRNKEKALSAEEGTGKISGTFEQLQTNLQEINNNIGNVHDVADKNYGQCKDVVKKLDTVLGRVRDNSKNLQSADDSASSLLKMSEGLFELLARTDYETEDTLLIKEVQGRASRISEIFENAVTSGVISEADLFDENYVDIAGTDPVQKMTAYISFVDKVLPEIQEPALELGDNIVFCAAVDRNAFLPTHNNKFSQPQKPGEYDWNMANSRNRRIFDDRTGLSAAQNTKPFLLQTYRRDMGGGNFVVMKDLSAPISVNGRHWGGLRLAYKPK
ncbi:methyl-accepting chemotaxis protein [Sneathiella sp. P13V-1]|uniref:methyl-accepting chemotaxis protein n=1 Tax=Sneathiella sp. P13V-1 TaxID=2697366 RepID=UPI00187B9EDF|nr:methyl-accepting chemotaxis protein [Sneathiella sp. P13V-1]MBE7636527.1 methyl-accepting chemotaxis protein [Sneathiella sp. P13V-1]